MTNHDPFLFKTMFTYRCCLFCVPLQVSTENYATPQTSVASRRVMRGRSVPPRAVSVPPRPLAQVENREMLQTSTTTPYPRPIVVLRDTRGVSLPRRMSMARGMSVPPVVIYPEARRERMVPPSQDWRSRAVRAVSVPPRSPVIQEPSFYSNTLPRDWCHAPIISIRQLT